MAVRVASSLSTVSMSVIRLLARMSRPM